MEAYTHLAVVYDYMLRHVDYHAWYEYIKAIMHNYVSNPAIIIELGCGTGKFGAKFSQDNYLVYGMDRSLEMLRVAKTRAYKNFRIFCGDMKKFAVALKGDFIFSVHDTMNYFTDYNEVRSVLECVKNSLAPNGIFMFDITTEYNINTNFDAKKNEYQILGKKIEWTNRYDKEHKLVHSYLSFINKDGSFQTEEHVQRIYSIEEMSVLLDEQGFEIIDILSDYTMAPPGEETVMINFIIRHKK